MLRFAPFLAFVCALAAAAPAAAQVPQTLSYQGVLTDGSGALVPDANYSLTFRLYTVGQGGAAIWTETHPSVAISNGGFGVTLGSITALTAAFDRPYWLGVQVGADPELAPRISLASSPYSLSLRLPFNANGNTGSALLGLRNSGAGPAITADPKLKVGGVQGDGYLSLHQVEDGASILVLRDYLNLGGSIEGYGSTGVLPLWSLGPDPDGGGFFSVAGTGAAFTVDGTSPPGNGPFVSVGGTRPTIIEPSASTANNSVRLPTDAVGASEMLDEPGLAHSNGNTLILDGTTQTLLSRTLNCPVNGYVLVIGSLHVQITHNDAVASHGRFGVADAAGAFSVDQDNTLQLSGAPDGIYTTPITVHGVFSVTAGSHTFYLLGDEGSGDLLTSNHNLTVVFFPTAYGTVTAPKTQEGSELRSMGMTRAEIDAERAQSEADDRARIARELDALRQEIELLKQREAARQVARRGEP